MQGRLQSVLAGAGVPAVTPLAVEEDHSWVGSPFLLMPRVAGRVVRADKPYLRTGWLAEAPPDGQAKLHAEMIDALGPDPPPRLGVPRLRSHRGAPGRAWHCRCRCRCRTTADRTDGWPGRSSTGPGIWPGRARERHRRCSKKAVAWCRTSLPHPEPPPSLLWGDVQLGNVLVDDDMGVSAVLDFEMASIGPAEVDLAWFVVLHEMAVVRCGGDLPGFPGRAATVATYESRLGRPVADLRWYEAFAALRSGAILVRAAKLLARLGVDDSWLTHENPTIDLLAGLISD